MDRFIATTVTLLELDMHDMNGYELGYALWKGTQPIEPGGGAAGQ